MPVTPDLDRKPQAAYVTAASLPSKYPPTRDLLWTSYARLQDELPEDEEIRQRPNSDAWERLVIVHTGESVVQDGQLQHVRRRIWRRVALSLAEARALSSSTEEADFWNGWTWVRRGRKPERDWAVMQAQLAPEDTFYEPAPPADQAVAAAVIAQQNAATSARLVSAESVAPRRGRPTNAEREARAAVEAAEQDQE